MRKKILFIDHFHDLSKIAETTALSLFGNGYYLVSAGIQPLKRFPASDNAFGTTALSVFTSERFDLVVAIGVLASEKVTMSPGLPPIIRWDDIDAATFDEFEKLKPLLQNRIADLVGSRYLDAILCSTTPFTEIVDSLQFGVIAHDLNRRVFLFSKGAEVITGVTADKVLGSDCHDLFSPRLCGGSCAFCEGECAPITTINATYTAQFLSGEGDRHSLQVTRQPLLDSYGSVIGALATFTDTTRLTTLEQRLHETESFAGIIGSDHHMLELFDLIRDLSDSDFPVVITGESGTGKELVAAAIHNESLRRDHLFVPVNCGALPEGTLESELFGHCKGAFTGAIRDKKGRFELAHRGTLFLDEIGDLSMPMQVKLLRVLQEGIIEPVGSEQSKKVDVRVICATNKNIREMVAQGTFREDLYYRIAVVPVEMPPLRERRNDIALLARHFLDKNSGRLSRGPVTFSDDALSILMNYQWPGNVRQLQNAIQFALIKCREPVIMPQHLPPEILAGTYIPLGIKNTPGKAGRRPKLTDDVVKRALEKTGGNKARAARLLGVGRATLYNFINGVPEKAAF